MEEKKAKGAKPLALRARIPGEGILASRGGSAPTPPSWKPRKKRRSKVVSLDFRPEDYEAVREAAEKRGLKLRTFCREAILKAAGKAMRLPPSSEIAQAYREVAYQVSKIGANLNQIAKHVNVHKTLDQDWLERLELIDRKLETLLKRLAP